MQIRRIFLGNSEIQGKSFYSTDPEFINRVKNVLRLREKSIVQVFDGNGMEYFVELNKVEKKEISGVITKTQISLPTPTPEIFIYQAITKPLSKFELVLQKGTELGASGFIPLISSRTSQFEKIKYERWKLIITEAAEQCELGKIPELFEIQELKNLKIEEGLTIFANENEENHHFSEILPEIIKEKRINIIIGPEGGFDNDEILSAIQKNFRSISLGKLILRTETVALAIVSAIRLSHKIL